VVQERVAVALGFAYCSLLIGWMLGDGAQSPLWNWLPPLWPWGWVVQSRVGRWIVVLALTAGTIAGIVSVLFFPAAA
jgi:hypothetical protein